MKKRILRAIFLCYCGCSSLLSYTQVTMGSVLPPQKGAILDLKDGNNRSTKGLMLPRVLLSDLHKLKMGDYEIKDGSTNEYIKHSGLVVFNIVETEPKVCADIPEGIYIWNGENWDSLQERAPISVEGQEQLVDNRSQIHGSQTYLTRRFGDAGVWMLENLRYIPVDATGASTIPFSKPEDYHDPDIDKIKCIYYPQEDNRTETDPTKTKPIWQPKFGVLYSFSAATLGVKDHITIDEGVAPEVSITRGVCPSGWHIPSDNEWSILEKVIHNNPEKYSSLTKDGEWDNQWESIQGERGPNLGNVFKSICEVPNRLWHDENAAGFIKEHGGFEVLLVGVCNALSAKDYSVMTSFWSSSVAYMNGTHRLAWARWMKWNVKGVGRDAAFKYACFPVRCKKD